MPPPLIFHCRWFLFIVLAGALPTLANAQDEWLDRSHAVFFPPKLGERIHTYHQFPATWWNFVTVKANPEKSKGQADPHLLCDHLIRRNANKDIQIVCGNRLDFVQPQLARWAADISIRSPYPGSKIFMQQLNAGLAKASLPLGKDLLVLIRSDPFSAYKDYRAIVEKKKVIGLPQDRGVFVDQERGRWAIPVRFQSPPSEAAQIQKFYETLEKACQVSNQCEGVGFVGPHASTYRNQNQIQKDLKRIGWIGPLVIVLFALLLWLFRLHRYILFFPPILLGIGISVVATVSFFGSIHGLTLSFGAGIIGLCLDYGLHGAFGAHEKQTWKTNTISLATTVVILLVVALSSIP